jgi:hypothetical protein
MNQTYSLIEIPDADGTSKLAIVRNEKVVFPKQGCAYISQCNNEDLRNKPFKFLGTVRTDREGILEIFMGGKTIATTKNIFDDAVEIIASNEETIESSCSDLPESFVVATCEYKEAHHGKLPSLDISRVSHPDLPGECGVHSFTAWVSNNVCIRFTLNLAAETPITQNPLSTIDLSKVETEIQKLKEDWKLRKEVHDYQWCSIITGQITILEFVKAGGFKP